MSIFSLSLCYHLLSLSLSLTFSGFHCVGFSIEYCFQTVKYSRSAYKIVKWLAIIHSLIGLIFWFYIFIIFTLPAMQRQWIKSAEMIHTVRQTIQNGFTAPTHLQPPQILVSFHTECSMATKKSILFFHKMATFHCHFFICDLNSTFLIPFN